MKERTHNENSKSRRILTYFVAMMMLCASMLSMFGAKTENVYGEDWTMIVDAEDFTLNHMVATDALGRTTEKISGYKSGKYVGLFYFLWHGQHKAEKARNVTELLRTNYNDLFSKTSTEIPYDAWLHWNEPLYGYYSSDDEWVLRKHIELFIEAGVDFIAMDYTNGIQYHQPLIKLLDLLNEYKANGYNVPKVTFYLNVNAETITNTLYRKIYTNAKYKDLMFYGNYDKPLLITVPTAIPAICKDYFTIRATQWQWEQYPDSVWPYWEVVEHNFQMHEGMVSVSPAQTNMAFSYTEPYSTYKGQYWPAIGRGWTNDDQTNGNVQKILEGANFQELFERAIDFDPEYIFVSGWNEWLVQKMKEADGTPHYTDNFNTEYSRDIEMTKSATYVSDGNGGYSEEGFGDNYLLQLIQNIREYKGKITTSRDKWQSKTIDVNGGADQWNSVTAKYVAVSNVKTARDGKANYSELPNYTQAAPDNFVKNVQISYDSDNVYFKIETDQNITAHQSGKTNWMNLFIGIEGSNSAAWNTYNYVINRNPGNGTTSVERVASDGEYSWTKIGDAQYSVSGNVMQIAISRDLIGVRGQQATILFKVADSIEEEDNILDYYVSGESFPMGRMSYYYDLAKDATGTIDPTEKPAGKTSIPGDDEGDEPEVIYKKKDNTPIIVACAAGGAAVCAVAVTAAVVVSKKRKK